MTTAQPRPTGSHRIHRIGLAAGAAKPSSGHAFASTQKHSDRIATALRTQEAPLPISVRSKQAAAIDRALLSCVASEPRRAPEVFRRLFDNTDPHALVRVLSECPTKIDVARVVANLPTRSVARGFLKAHLSL